MWINKLPQETIEPSWQNQWNQMYPSVKFRMVVSELLMLAMGAPNTFRSYNEPNCINQIVLGFKFQNLQVENYMKTKNEKIKEQPKS